MAENVVKEVIFSGFSENFQIKVTLEPCYKVLFLAEPFPSQRIERTEPLKSKLSNWVQYGV